MNPPFLKSNSVMLMSKPELYVSLDIETNGPCPGLNSMLSIGAAAFTITSGTPVDTFYRKMFPMQGIEYMENSDTMKWWDTQPEAWEEVNREQVSPAEAMHDFGFWLDGIQKGHHAKLVAAAWPAAFDFGYVNYYLHQFYGDNPLGFACLDIRSYANGLFNTAGYYERISEGDLYKKYELDITGLRPHVAVDDAVKQGMLLMSLIEEARMRQFRETA